MTAVPSASMEFADLVQSRRMVRAFDTRPVEPRSLDRVLDAARRAPSAGNAQGWVFVVLEGDDTRKFWDVTLPEERRETFRWKQLLDAPVVILPLASREAYLSRYSEPDKISTGPGRPHPVAGALLADRHRLRHDAAAAGGGGRGPRAPCSSACSATARSCWPHLDVPGGYELIGAVALGYPPRRRARSQCRAAPAQPRRDRAPGRLAGRSVPAVAGVCTGRLS